MGIDLYYMLESPPCRTVLMVAKLLNIELNLKSVDLSKGEHLNKDFVELNPCHCLPTIVDNGLVLWESRAIITYLVNNYQPSHPLYPSDPKLRAIVDKYLQFDSGTLYKSISQYLYPYFFGGQLEDANENKLKETLNLLDSMLANNKFICGQHLSLADISLISGFTLLESADYQINGWKHICQWIQNVKQELKDCYQEFNEKAIQNTRDYIQTLKNANNQ